MTDVCFSKPEIVIFYISQLWIELLYNVKCTKVPPMYQKLTRNDAYTDPQCAKCNWCTKRTDCTRRAEMIMNDPSVPKCYLVYQLLLVHLVYQPVYQT